MLDTALVAYIVQRISDLNQRRKYRKAAQRMEYPFARTFSYRLPKG